METKDTAPAPRPSYLPSDFPIRSAPGIECPFFYVAARAVQHIEDAPSPGGYAHRGHMRHFYFSCCQRASSAHSDRQKKGKDDGLQAGQFRSDNESMERMTHLGLSAVKNAKKALCEIGLIHCYSPMTGKRGEARRAPTIYTLRSVPFVKKEKKKATVTTVEKTHDESNRNLNLSPKEREMSKKEKLAAEAAASLGLAPGD